MELCKILSRTPSEIGELRREKPMDIRFLEKKIISTWVKSNEEIKEMERKSKQSSRKSRIGR